jgi:phosphopantetheinyl transferase
MVTVGDDNRVLLFNISYSGNYELMQTMAGKEKKKRLAY